MANVAQTGRLSGEGHQQCARLVATLALRRSRRYLPGVQWEYLYGQVPWRPLLRSLGVNACRDGSAIVENATDDVEEPETESESMPADVERVADGVEKVVDFLVRQIQGRSGFKKLHQNQASEYRIRAWLKKVASRELRRHWRRNCPRGNQFYRNAMEVLQHEFVLLHDGVHPRRAITDGFYAHHTNWWGLKKWQTGWPRPLSEAELRDRLVSVSVAFQSREDMRSKIHRLFLLYFEAAGSPIPEQLLLDCSKEMLGIWDREPPASLERPLRQADDEEIRTIEDQVQDQNWKKAFSTPDLEVQAKRLVALLTPRQREAARRFLSAELDDDDLKQLCDWDLGIPSSTFYVWRAKFLAGIRAVATKEDAPIINLLIEELFHRSR